MDATTTHRTDLDHYVVKLTSDRGLLFTNGNHVCNFNLVLSIGKVLSIYKDNICIFTMKIMSLLGICQIIAFSYLLNSWYVGITENQY